MFHRTLQHIAENGARVQLLLSALLVSRAPHSSAIAEYDARVQLLLSVLLVSPHGSAIAEYDARVQLLLSVMWCSLSSSKRDALFAVQFSCCGVYGDINSTTSWAFYRNTVWYFNQTGEQRQRTEAARGFDAFCLQHAITMLCGGCLHLARLALF